MKNITRTMLQDACNLCDEEDRSTEYMLQFMQDYAHVDLDCALNFLQSEH